MELVHQAYKFRIYPSKEQVERLNSWFGSCRFLYNLCLEQRILWWQQYRVSVNYFDQANELKNLKKVTGFEWLKDPPAQCLQQSLKDLEKSFKSFFQSHFGFPKFKKRGEKEALRFPDPKQFTIKSVNKKRAILELPKIGKISVKLSRAINGKIKNATLKKEGSNWTIAFCTELELQIPLNTKPKVGIDRGIAQTVALSDETNFTKAELTIPKRAKELFFRIKKLQSKLKNRKKFSTNWRRIQLKIAKLHRKIGQIRSDFLHKLSTRITKNHGYIVLEDLKIKNMTKSARGTIENPGTKVRAKSGLNREILFQGWGLFAFMLEYKSKREGGYLEVVNPQFTSQRCSACLFQSKENRKGKNFECLNCGFKDDADENAAKNISAAGRAGYACGGPEVVLADEARTTLGA